MTITPQFLDEIRSRLTLSDVIGGRIKLARAGREFKACCPFHKEKTPSFYINDDKQFFHCFGCGAHGDAVGFIMRHDHLSFPEAVEQLAARAGLKMPDYAPEDAARAKTEKSLYSCMELAALWFEGCLADPKNADVLRYMTGRGLTLETIHAFRLGFAPFDDRALCDHLKQAGYTEDQMVTLGLIKRREKDGSSYAFFRDRVIFPVADRSGRVIAFGGRILPESVRPPVRGTEFKPPKYLNSPETPLFQKGRTVYAIAQARAGVQGGQKPVVVEGYMDVIACHQAGIKGAVAPLGTALTEDQIQLLWKMIPAQEKTILLCFDGDDAGRRAAGRAADRILPLLKPDHSARIAFLPEGEDPDTLIEKRGVAAFQTVLDRAQPLAEYLWAGCLARRNLDSPEDRAGLESEIEGLVNRIVDPKTKYYYQKFFRDKMAERFRPALWSGLTKGGKGVMPVFRPPIERPKRIEGRAVDVLLSVLMQNINLFDQVDEMIGTLVIHDPLRDKLRQMIIELLSSQRFDSGADLAKVIVEGNPDLESVIAELYSDPVMIHARFARADADPADVLAGWIDVYHHVMKKAS